MTDPLKTDGQRITIDLTPEATEEIDRLRSITGLTTGDIFRYALSLLRIYINAKAAGMKLEVVDKTGNTRTEIPEI